MASVSVGAAVTLSPGEEQRFVQETFAHLRQKRIQQVREREKRRAKTNVAAFQYKQQKLHNDDVLRTKQTELTNLLHELEHLELLKKEHVLSFGAAHLHASSLRQQAAFSAEIAEAKSLNESKERANRFLEAIKAERAPILAKARAASEAEDRRLAIKEKERSRAQEAVARAVFPSPVEEETPPHVMIQSNEHGQIDYSKTRFHVWSGADGPLGLGPPPKPTPLSLEQQVENAKNRTHAAFRVIRKTKEAKEVVQVLEEAAALERLDKLTRRPFGMPRTAKVSAPRILPSREREISFENEPPRNEDRKYLRDGAKRNERVRQENFEESTQRIAKREQKVNVKETQVPAKSEQKLFVKVDPDQGDSIVYDYGSLVSASSEVAPARPKSMPYERDHDPKPMPDTVVNYGGTEPACSSETTVFLRGHNPNPHSPPVEMHESEELCADSMPNAHVLISPERRKSDACVSFSGDIPLSSRSVASTVCSSVVDRKMVELLGEPLPITARVQTDSDILRLVDEVNLSSRSQSSVHSSIVDRKMKELCSQASDCASDDACGVGSFEWSIPESTLGKEMQSSLQNHGAVFEKSEILVHRDSEIEISDQVENAPTWASKFLEDELRLSLSYSAPSSSEVAFFSDDAESSTQENRISYRVQHALASVREVDEESLAQSARSDHRRAGARFDEFAAGPIELTSSSVLMPVDENSPVRRCLSNVGVCESDNRVADEGRASQSWSLLSCDISFAANH